MADPRPRKDRSIRRGTNRATWERGEISCCRFLQVCAEIFRGIRFTNSLLPTWSNFVRLRKALDCRRPSRWFLIISSCSWLGGGEIVSTCLSERANFPSARFQEWTRLGASVRPKTFVPSNSDLSRCDRSPPSHTASNSQQFIKMADQSRDGVHGSQPKI